MPRRPPKWWFKKCVKSMTRKKVKKLHVRDAFKLCGYIWYHHTGAKRRAEILAIEKKRLAAAKRAAARRRRRNRPILDRIRSAFSARSPESKLSLTRQRPRKTSVKICRKYDLVRRSKNGAESPEECFRRLSPKIGFGRAAAACSKDKATSHFIAAAMLPHGKMSVLATGSSEQMKSIARSTSKAKRVTTVVYDNTGRSMATYSLYGSAMLPPARKRKISLEFWRPSDRRSTPEEECLTYARHYTNSWKEAFHVCLAAKKLGVHPREILKEEKAPITPRAAEPARGPNRSRRR